jgi:glycosyltransferase involved in cell wall biosynthesis
MKILIDGRVLKHYKVTGVERYTIEISQELRNIVDTKIVVPRFSNRFYQHLWEHLILPFRSRKYDLLFSPANIAPIWKPKNTKLVMTLHDNAFITHPESISKLFYYYYKYAIPRALRIADKVVTISNFSKDEIIKSYPFVIDKIKVIYNGVGIEKFAPIKHGKKDNYILFVGSLNPRKNFVRLIEAFEVILNKRDIELKMVGNFSDIYTLTKKEQSLIKSAKQNSKISFLEDVDDLELINLYQKAKVFIFPSTYEGFGLPPLEAMSCGTPVIASNIAPLPDIYEDSVLYIDPFDTKDIVAKIETFLSDEVLQTELIYKGHQRVKQFTWEESAKKYVKLFKEVLKS